MCVVGPASIESPHTRLPREDVRPARLPAVLPLHRRHPRRPFHDRSEREMRHA